MKFQRTDLEQRFFEKMAYNAETGCWDWTAAVLPNNYGRISLGGTGAYAHRVAYRLFVGPIPEGMTIDHMCHNPDDCAGGWTCPHRRCVNPAHLEAVSMRTNVLRSHAPTAANARRTHCIQGHEFTESNTYRYPTTGKRACRACHRENRRVENA